MSKIMTTEQALREALFDEISAAAAMAGPCQEGLMPRCRCFKCRRGRSIAALALPVPEVTLEYRVVWEFSDSDGWAPRHALSANVDSARETLQSLSATARYRNVRIESRVAAGPWLPVAQP